MTDEKFVTALNPELSARIAEVSAELDLPLVVTENGANAITADTSVGPDSVVVAAQLKRVEAMTDDDKKKEAQDIRDFYSRAGKEFRRHGRRTQIKRVAVQLARVLRDQAEA
jgi:hypothetical protein